MQTVRFAAHNYVDLSDLNAKWDQALPAVAGLGSSNGVLSGNALQVVAGLGEDPHYPWREYSADTEALQVELNKALTANGYLPLEKDGVLGPGTCGAIRAMCEMVDGPCEAPSSCQSFTAPSRPGGGGGSFPRPVPGTTTASLSGGPNWILMGGAVGAIAIGAALILKKKRR